MYNEFFSNVHHFNRHVLKIEPRAVGELPTNEYELAVNQLNEEISEFQEAYETKNFIGQIDALIDLMYFATGILYKMGISDEMIGHIGNLVHSANMEKKLGTVARRAVEGAADAVKPDGWVAPEERIMHYLTAVAQASESQLELA